MSIRALNWAYAQPVKGPAKAVLCALSYRANGKTGQCNPSIARIAADVGLGKTAVKKAIRALADGGHITVVNRSAAGCKLANDYVLGCNQALGGASRGDQGGRTRVDLGRDPAKDRSSDGHKLGREHGYPSQEERGAEVEDRREARRLRVVGGCDEPTPFDWEGA